MSDTIIINYPTDEGLTINVDDNDDVIVNIIDEPNIIVNLCDDLGTTANNYDYLDNKPSINNVALIGNKTLDDLGIEPAKGADNNFVTDSEKAELHTHTNKSVLNTITSVLVSGWNAAATWVSTYGANVLTHIADSSIHVTATLLSTINNKVDKVEGKGLSTNDFTNEQKELLSQQSGVNTGDQDLSGLEPKRGIDDFYLTNAEKTQGALATGNLKLSSIKLLSSTVLNNIETKIDKKLGKNLFDKNSNGIINGKYLNSIGEITDNPLYYISGYIPVNSGNTYAHSNFQIGGAYSWIYDSDLNKISSFNSSPVTIPINGAYIRMSGTMSNKDIQQIEVGTSITSYENYIEYMPLIDINNKMIILDNAKLSKKLGKNLLNPNDPDILLGKYLMSEYVLSNPSYSISGYIWVYGLQNVAINFNLSGAFIVFYNKNKSIISYSETGTSWSVPSDAYYLRVSGGGLSQSSWQVESGTSFTTFEKYRESLVESQVPDRETVCVLPKMMYFVKNKQSCIYHENVLFKNLNDPTTLYVDKGVNYSRQTTFNHQNASVNQTAKFQIIRSFKKGALKNTIYNVIDPVTNNGKTINVLHIGDSFTDMGIYLKECKSQLNSQGVTYNLIGTCGDSTFRAEGLSGGTLANTFLDASAGVGRRVQVTGVSILPSTSYPGRVYRDANGKDWSIRSGKIDGSGNGYVVVTKYGATESDFINFPAAGILTKQSAGEGDSVISYSNPTMCYFNPFINSSNGQLDMLNYLTTWGLSNPDIIVVQFTWNDLPTWASDAVINSIVTNFKLAADHIHAALPSSKLVISIEPFGAINGNLDVNGKKYSVLRFTEFIIAKFEDDINYNTWVKIAPSYAFVDLINGYSSSSVAPCERYSSITEVSGGDGIHPSTIGMQQIADCISQIIACII